MLFDIDDISTLIEPGALAKSAVELVNDPPFGSREDDGWELIKQLPTKEKVAAIRALKSDLGVALSSTIYNNPFRQ